MWWTQDVLITGAGIIFAGMALGAGVFFRRPRGLSTKMKLTGVLAALMTAAELAALGAAPGTWMSFLPALALLTLSGALYLWCIRTMRPTRPALAFSASTPRELVQNGPYAHVRHPFYTSYLLFWLGGSIGAQQPWLLIGLALMTFIYHRAARQEEVGFLSGPLAEDYAGYRRRTGMFLPRLRRP